MSGEPANQEQLQLWMLHPRDILNKSREEKPKSWLCEFHGCPASHILLYDTIDLEERAWIPGGRGYR